TPEDAVDPTAPTPARSSRTSRFECGCPLHKSNGRGSNPGATWGESQSGILRGVVVLGGIDRGRWTDALPGDRAGQRLGPCDPLRIAQFAADPARIHGPMLPQVAAAAQVLWEPFPGDDYETSAESRRLRDLRAPLQFRKVLRVADVVNAP